ncbi:hypothetical protein SERLA73DRAFT_178071 [Serpula lacrymans var. lacrymans S7.3]|uniref:Zinc finger PHD-type domain-containing protein n=2 Tax=Serpula lacrymans var. lacrymans TaxID=341189 RepID=F8PQH9_SERL3|nr:uncharacterized protein SERLADRAFT_462260 [Serpula lacrymans var. lacrymans S7.9]EGO02227.1 hypothetical protein SERLA73DRAFT_178071 [Serpula lacrymans var. lacrymans S7.3]EGO27944.1 hypothetical protein SERLADRAFT_462260 [Serpula lacrymans var. lacrymans S7.9]
MTLNALAAEKIVLATRIVELISRARARLEHDLGRVLVLQGEPDPAATVSAPALAAIGAGTTGVNAEYVLGGRNPAQQITESLRNAFAGGAGIASGGSGVGVGAGAGMNRMAVAVGGPEFGGAQKKRKLNTLQGSIKLPSPAPASLYNPALNHHGRGRRRRARDASSDNDADDYDFGDEGMGEEEGEGGEEGGEGEEVDDKALYCFCQKLSYGEMVACDNPTCPYQWFHLPCVGLKPPLPETFFCSECTRRGMGAPTASGPGRKGRKK